MFTTRHGSPVDPRNFNRKFTRRTRRPGVPQITVHDARRTSATLLVELDLHPRVIMQVLRHARFSLTIGQRELRTNSWYWGPKIEGNRARDADTDAQLRAAGWDVIRVWEHEDPQIAALRIAAVVRQRLEPTRDPQISPRVPAGRCPDRGLTGAT